MTKKSFYSITLFLTCILVGCNDKSNNEPITNQCHIDINTRFFTQNEMTAVFRNDIIQKLASGNLADASGAMNRNQTAYFHVRFQMGVSPLADYVVAAQSLTYLDMLVKAIEYSFSYQNQNGDFQLVIPAELAANNTATEGDRASGDAFFLSSLGSALLALQENSGYQSQTAYKKRLEILNTKFILALDFIKSKKELLKNVDALAPNRLFFDALAFYAMGRYLNDAEAMAIGIEFVNLAMARKHTDGYFLEGTGWDTSYQGVGLAIGFRLLNILQPNATIRQNLYNCLACGTSWEMSRIKTTGEISTEGNTRVFSGGETFLGQEKGMAYSSVVIALWNMYYYSGKIEYNDIAIRVLAFYGN
jgi:hypothetical protein